MFPPLYFYPEMRYNKERFGKNNTVYRDYCVKMGAKIDYDIVIQYIIIVRL